MQILTNKVIVVFGGAGGSGKAISSACAEEGAFVGIADKNGEGARSLSEELNAKGCRTIAFKCDTTRKEDVEHVIDTLIEKCGRVDGAANIVGASTDFTDLINVSDEHFDVMVNINIRSAFYCLKKEITVMKEQGDGSIIIMGSSGSFFGHQNMGLYDMTKHALLGLTRSAAVDYVKDGIRINLVSPGAMLTDGMQYMINQDPHFADGYLANMPANRFIDTQNVANTFVFLFSDYAKQITGAAITIDDGLTALCKS